MKINVTIAPLASAAAGIPTEVAEAIQSRGGDERGRMRTFHLMIKMIEIVAWLDESLF